jgi:hypothetical protein
MFTRMFIHNSFSSVAAWKGVEIPSELDLRDIGNVIRLHGGILGAYGLAVRYKFYLHSIYSVIYTPER